MKRALSLFLIASLVAGPNGGSAAFARPVDPIKGVFQHSSVFEITALSAQLLSASHASNNKLLSLRGLMSVIATAAFLIQGAWAQNSRTGAPRSTPKKVSAPRKTGAAAPSLSEFDKQIRAAAKTAHEVATQTFETFQKSYEDTLSAARAEYRQIPGDQFDPIFIDAAAVRRLLGILIASAEPSDFSGTLPEAAKLRRLIADATDGLDNPFDELEAELARIEKAMGEIRNTKSTKSAEFKKLSALLTETKEQIKAVRNGIRQRITTALPTAVPVVSNPLTAVPTRLTIQGSRGAYLIPVVNLGKGQYFLIIVSPLEDNEKSLMILHLDLAGLNNQTHPIGGGHAWVEPTLEDILTKHFRSYIELSNSPHLLQDQHKPGWPPSRLFEMPGAAPTTPSPAPVAEATRPSEAAAPKPPAPAAATPKAQSEPKKPLIQAAVLRNVRTAIAAGKEMETPVKRWVDTFSFNPRTMPPNPPNPQPLEKAREALTRALKDLETLPPGASTEPERDRLRIEAEGLVRRMDGYVIALHHAPGIHMAMRTATDTQAALDLFQNALSKALSDAKNPVVHLDPALEEDADSQRKLYLAFIVHAGESSREPAATALLNLRKAVAALAPLSTTVPGELEATSGETRQVLLRLLNHMKTASGEITDLRKRIPEILPEEARPEDPYLLKTDKFGLRLSFIPGPILRKEGEPVCAIELFLPMESLDRDGNSRAELRLYEFLSMGQDKPLSRKITENLKSGKGKSNTFKDLLDQLIPPVPQNRAGDFANPFFLLFAIFPVGAPIPGLDWLIRLSRPRGIAATYYKGKTALVIGGTLGIGRDIAAELIRRGSDVIVASRDPLHRSDALEWLNGIRHSYSPTSKPVEALPMNVARPLSVRDGFQTLERQSRVPDIVVDTAGLARGRAADRLPQQDKEALWGTNVIGKQNVLEELLPFWRAHPADTRRHIVLASSLAAVFHVPGYFAYGATMAAVSKMVYQLRNELILGENIGVTALLSPDVDTPGLKEERDHSDPWVQLVTASKLWVPQEIAEILLNKLPHSPAEVIPGWDNRLQVWTARHFPFILNFELQRRYRLARAA